MESLESRVEQLCATISRTDNDNWDVKNKAVQTITELCLEYDREAFTPGLFRALKEPVKALVCDLRSQQVRDVCALLSILAQVSGEKMKLFLRDSFPHILEGIKVPNKVMSGYVDECIFQMIKYTPFKTALPILLQEVRDNKSKTVREKCLDYLNEMLINWELTEKEVDPMCEALKIGLEDASIKAREISRIAYGNLYLLFPAKAEKMRSALSKGVQAKLVAIERTLVENSSAPSEQKLILQAAAQTSADESMFSSTDDAAAQIHTESDRPRTPSHHHTTQGALSPAPSPAKEPPALSLTVPAASVAATPRPLSASSNASRTVNKTTVSVPNSAARKEKEREKEKEKESDPYISLSNSTSASSLAASVRGASSRRRSIVKNPFAELSDSFASTNREREREKERERERESRRPVSVGSPSMSSTPTQHRRSPSKDSISGTRRSPGRDSLSSAQQWQPFSYASSNNASSPRPSSAKRTTTPTQLHREREREREKEKEKDKNATPVRTHTRSRSAAPAPSSAEKDREREKERGRENSRPQSASATERRAVSANRAVVSVPSSVSAASAPATRPQSVEREKEGERALLQQLQPLSGSSQISSAEEIEAQRGKERLTQQERSADRERERQWLREREEERERDAQIEREREKERVAREREEAMLRDSEKNSASSTAASLALPKPPPIKTATDEAAVAAAMMEELEKDKDREKDTNVFPQVGQRVIVTWGKDPVYREIGTVRFFGLTLFASGLWVGVELEMQLGKNNGTVQGHYYFSCPPGYGLFVRKENVYVFDNEKELERKKKEMTTTNTPSVEETRDPPQQGDSSNAAQETEGVKETERSVLLRSVSVNGTTGARKKASVLKIKLSQMMNLLNQQLEIVEEIEQEEKKAAALSESLANPLAVPLSAVSTGTGQYTVQEMARIQERLNELKEEVDMITVQEVDVIDGFRRRWKELSQ